jgi:ABC-type lipoprotein release transport system permease subunit
VLRRFLYGIAPTDLSTFVGLSFLLVTIAAAACLIPARRAMKVNPMTALRHE